MRSEGLVPARSMRDEVRRGVLLAVSRFGPEIRAVAVRLKRAPGLLGGVDQHCELRARMRSGAELTTEAIGDGIEAVVTSAAAHLALLVASSLAGPTPPASASRSKA